MIQKLIELFGGKKKTVDNNVLNIQRRKLQADTKGEPFFEVVNYNYNIDNPNEGNFELEWNNVFVKQCRAWGYPGKTDEEVVDNYFTNVCRNIAMEMFQKEMGDPVNRQISRRELDGNLTEYS